MSRRLKNLKSPLGAMSWRVPEDDWDSPWGFEDEWLKPSASRKKTTTTTTARPQPVATEPQSAPNRAVLGVRRTDNVILRFDMDDPVIHAPEPIAPRPRPAKKQPAQVPAPAPVEEPRLRLSPSPQPPPPPVVAPPSTPAPVVQRPMGVPRLQLPKMEDFPYVELPKAEIPKTEPLRTELPPAPISKTEIRRDEIPSHVEIPEVEPPAVRTASALLQKALRQQPSLPPPLQRPEPDKGPRPYNLETLPQPKVEYEAEPDEDFDQRKARLSKRGSFSWGSLISLGMGTLGFTLLAWIYLHDEPRESDEDLRPAIVVDQTPTTQAPGKLRAFLDSIVPVQNLSLRREPPWTWDTPSLAGFVRANGTALDNLHDLLEDYDWHPRHAAWYKEDLSTHPAGENVGYLLQAQSAYLARRGDEEPAFVAAVDLAELSRRMQDVWAWPGYMHQALELQLASVQLLAELLKNTHLDSAKLLRFQEEFTQCKPDDELMRQIFAAYYVHEKKLLLGPASGELLDTMPAGQLHQRPGRLFFKMNETLGLFASGFRDLRDEINRPPYTRLSVSTDPSSRIRLTSPQFYQPNSSGETYFSQHIEPYLRLPQDHNLAQARHELVRSLFALRRYLVDKQKLPGQLHDLTPDYLPIVPRDPFSGESLHYEAERGLLFSVGINLIPEGGKPSQPPLNDDREPTLEVGVSLVQKAKK